MITPSKKDALVYEATADKGDPAIVPCYDDAYKWLGCLSDDDWRDNAAPTFTNSAEGVLALLAVST